MPKAIPELQFRGGVAHDVKRVYVTHRALEQFVELSQNNENIYELLENVTQVKRFADHSDFFIYVHEQYRFVFTVERSRELSSGRFVLVKVEIQYQR